MFLRAAIYYAPNVMDWLYACLDQLLPSLTPADLITLQGWMRMSTLGRALAERARIQLLLADGMTPKAVSDPLQVTGRRYSSGESAIWKLELKG